MEPPVSIPTEVTTSPSGVVSATNDIEFSLAGFAYGESLEGRLIVPVPNVAARDALVASFGPTVQKPLVVFRADAPAHLKVEYTTNGTTWTSAGGSDSGWVSPASVASAWSGSQSNFKSRLEGKRVTLRGFLGPLDGTAAAGNHNQVAQLASGHRPPAGQTYRWAVSATATSTTPTQFKACAEVAINALGDVYVYCTEEIAGVTLNNVDFYID